MKFLAITFSLISLLLYSTVNAQDAITPKNAVNNEIKPLRIAILPSGSSDKSLLASLLEVQLSTQENYVVLDRESISEIIKEWDLVTLSSPASVAKRSELGRLLKADILVMLSEKLEPTPRIDLVVSETTQGLRLRSTTIPISNDQNETLRGLRLEIEAASAKQAEGLKEIYAVPPFVSMDLSHDHAHLSVAYSKIVEEMMNSIPGVLVVEITEARKISEESLLTGTKVQRAQPVYLLGEYRFDTVNRDKPPFLRLIAKRSEQEIWRKEATNPSPTTAVAFLRNALQEQLRSTDNNQLKKPDEGAELQILAKRARDHFAVGFYEESTQLAESALLLDSQQIDLHRLAMSAYISCCRKEQKPVLQELRYREIALSHAEILLMQTKLDYSNIQESVALSNSVSGVKFNPYAPLKKANDEERKAILNYLNMTRDMFISVIKAKHQSGHLNDAVLDITLTNWLFEHETYDEPLRANLQKRLEIAPLLIAKGVERPESHLKDLTIFGLSDAMKASEDFTWFIDQLAQIKHPATTKVVAYSRQVNADLKAGKKVSLSTIDPKEKSDDSAIIETTSEQVQFNQIKFNIPSNEPFWLQGLLNCGNNTDILWGYNTSNSIFLMKEKGLLKPVYKIGNNQSFGQVCFDGKYVWIPLQGTKSEILAINPTSGTVVRFTTEDGLPEFKSSACAPLGQGRICYSAGFGIQSNQRAYIAVLDLSEGGEKKVKIIHEAMRQPLPSDTERDAEMDANLSYVPGFMLSQPSKNGDSWNVILKRRYHNSCLSIQPDTGKVEVFRVEQYSLSPDEVTFQQNRAVWEAGGFLKSLHPDIKEIQRARQVPKSKHGVDVRVLLQNSRTHVVGDHWWISDNDNKKFRALLGKIPGNPSQNRRIYLSSHYGIIFTSSTDKDKAYEVVISDSLPPDK